MFGTLCRSLVALAVFLPAATFAQVAVEVEGPAMLMDVFVVDGGGSPVGPGWDSLVADGEITMTNGSVLPPGSTLFPGDEIAEGMLMNMAPSQLMVVFADGYNPMIPAGQALLVSATASIRCVDKSNTSTVNVGDELCKAGSIWNEPYSIDPEVQCAGTGNTLTTVRTAAEACQAAAGIMTAPPDCVSPCVQQGELTDTENKVAGKSCTVTRTRTCVEPAG